MAKGYRFVSHTADVEFVASGGTLEITFKNALLALFDTMSYVGKVATDRSKVRSFTLKEHAKDVNTLLWYFLQDALSMLDSNDAFGYDVSGLHIVSTAKGHMLTAKLYAKARSDAASKLDVKGVSGYDLKVEKKSHGFAASVVLDV